jgi:Phage tail protein
MPSKLVLPGVTGAYVSAPLSKPITVAAGTVSRTSNVVTWNAPANHGVRVGDSLTVDLTDNTYDGTFTVTAVDGNVITWAQVVANDTDGGTGTITNTTSFRQVGVVELWAELAAVSYLPASGWDIAARWSAPDGQVSALWQVNTDGRLRMIWTPTGFVAGQIISESVNPLTAPDGVRVVLCYRLHPVWGSGWRVEFLVYDRIDGLLLEDLGAASGAGTTSIFTGTRPLEIGSRDLGTAAVFAGDMFRVLYRDNGVMLAAPDFTLQTPGATTFTDITGRTYTVNGTATIVDDPVPEPEPPPAPVPVEPDVVELELGGTTLQLTEAEGLVNNQLDLGWPTLRPVVADRPQVDGTVDTTDRFGARAISLVVTAVDTYGPAGTIARTWKQNLARLTKLLGAAKRPTLHIRVDGLDYRIGLAPDQVGAPFVNPNHNVAQLAFRAPDPYLRGRGKSVTGYPFRAGTTGRTYPLTFPRTYPDSGAVSGDFDVMNEGDVDVWPIVNIWGPLATSFTLENVTTGQIFSMTSTTVDVNNRLEVDMHNRTVRINGDPRFPRFSLVNFVASSWIRLVPGTNRLRFLTGATSDAFMSVDFAAPYLMPGGQT